MTDDIIDYIKTLVKNKTVVYKQKKGGSEHDIVEHKKEVAKKQEELYSTHQD